MSQELSKRGFRVLRDDTISLAWTAPDEWPVAELQFSARSLELVHYALRQLANHGPFYRVGEQTPRGRTRIIDPG